MGAEDLCSILIPFLSHHLQADVFHKNINSMAKSILKRGSQDIFCSGWPYKIFNILKSPDQLNVQLHSAILSVAAVKALQEHRWLPL